MLLNISSYASADLFDQASLLKHMKKYSIAHEWASNCSHYPVVHITPGYLTAGCIHAHECIYRAMIACSIVLYTSLMLCNYVAHNTNLKYMQ